ncbi:MAG: transcriptional regulator [Spirochaetaceae bacterium]|jgi:hypothetical protein|nr:transcriptional regulator [Spirochaetaceae bacterium]
MSNVIAENALHYQASQDFNKARNKAILSRIQHFMHLDKDKLLSFNDVKDILKPKNQAYKGMQIVPVNLIVGSEGRYRDFNKYFLPRSERLRNRWERVDEALLKDIILPPIQLYEIGGAYFVRDGNHRVSVARSQGVEVIDAEVISLSSEIAINPAMTTDDLRHSLIQYEKHIFYEKTEFGTLTADYDLDFKAPGQYDVIYNHILVHKYYLNQGKTEEITFAEALVSWYNKVYSPIIRIIKDEWIEVDFPGYTPSDLYVWIVKHWDFLKKKYGVHYSLAKAARDFSHKHGQSKGRVLRFLSVLLGRIFKDPLKKFNLELEKVQKI